MHKWCRVKCMDDAGWDAWMQCKMQDVERTRCRMKCEMQDAEWDPWMQREMHGYSQFHGCKGCHQDADCVSLLAQSGSFLVTGKMVSGSPKSTFFYVLQSKRKRDHLSTISIYQIHPNSHFSEIARFTCFHLHSSWWSRRGMHTIRWVGSCGAYTCGKGGGTPWQIHQYDVKVGSRLTRTNHWDNKNNVLTTGRKE